MMRRVVPGVKRVRIRRASVTVQSLRPIVGEGNQGYRSLSKFLDEENLLGLRVIGQEIVLDMNSGNSIPAHALSEGTLLTLGILTALISPQRPNLILLEDIQQGLHPRAQREIINILKELLQNNEDLQIIFSTHSPYILDALDPSQVHVLTTAKTGFTQTKRLDEHPDAEWAKQTLTTGEFWDSTGEDWVAEA
jgi:ABC-type dipeptide/oligopeptide/nickel transport system ATPase subunit